MRDAIILVSFGSADDAIRAATFDRLAAELRAQFPDFEVREAFTSDFMIRKLSRRGVIVNTPAAEIADLRGAGVRKIFLLPTHLTAGEEFDNKIATCAAPDVEVISPLMSEPLDPKILATVIDCFPREDDEDLVLIGHGSPHRHNPVYERLQTLAGADVHIGVIESTDTPNFADVIGRLGGRSAKKILLAPLLFNGGVHVTADIDGDENSWRGRLTAHGYEVRVIRDGLGTFEGFRRLYVERLGQRVSFTVTRREFSI